MVIIHVIIPVHTEYIPVHTGMYHFQHYVPACTQYRPVHTGMYQKPWFHTTCHDSRCGPGQSGPARGLPRRRLLRRHHTQMGREFHKNYEVLTSGFLQVQEFFSLKLRDYVSPFLSYYFIRHQNQRGTPETTSHWVGEWVKRAQARPFLSLINLITS